MSNINSRRAPSDVPLRLRHRVRVHRPTLSIRIDFEGQFALGPGKVRLMELIAQHGSISAAGRAMGMSYRRAWLLVEDLNEAFRQPLVMTKTGGTRGGGAELTTLGRSIVERYRSIQATATANAGADLRALASVLSQARR
jgi:molybdate transport system regulatory protein